jgi:hypothetical protein
MSPNTGNLISATQTRNKAALKKFRRFMESQQFFVFIGVVVYALAAALKVRGSFAFIMICILCVGNTVGPVMTACARLYENRAFPSNWLLFLPIMALGSVVGALFAVVLMRLLATSHS